MRNRQVIGFGGLEGTPALQEYLTFISNHPKSGRLNPEIEAACAYFSGTDQATICRFIHELNCDWVPVLRDFYGPETSNKWSRQFVAGLIEAAKVNRNWNVETAYACLSAMVRNPGIDRPNFPYHFRKIPDLLRCILSSGIRLPNQGEFELLHGQMKLYFNGFADGDPVIRQMNELFRTSHATFLKIPDRPFDDLKFKRFLRMLGDDPYFKSPRRGAFDCRVALTTLQSDYLAWEKCYGNHRWYELNPPAQAEPLPDELHRLSRSLGSSKPTINWFRRASDALANGEISRKRLEFLLSLVGTRDFAMRSEAIWYKARPALYLYALYRHYEGEINPINASRFVRNRLQNIAEQGVYYDAHVGPTKSGTYRNPLCLSKENTPIIQAAFWTLSLFNDDCAVASLGDAALSLGTSFYNPGTGRYLRSLAGCTAAIRALQSIPSSAASAVLRQSKAGFDDERILALI